MGNSRILAGNNFHFFVQNRCFYLKTSDEKNDLPPPQLSKKGHYTNWQYQALDIISHHTSLNQPEDIIIERQRSF